jgi:hypothetical protein
VHPLPPEVRAEMERLVTPMRTEWRDRASPSGKRLLAAIEAELARFRKTSKTSNN